LFYNGSHRVKGHGAGLNIEKSHAEQ
jgi:hypothetical protein